MGEDLQVQRLLFVLTIFRSGLNRPARPEVADTRAPGPSASAQSSLHRPTRVRFPPHRAAGTPSRRSALLRLQPSSGAAWDDDEFVEPAFEIAVKDRNALRRGKADKFRHTSVTR